MDGFVTNIWRIVTQESFEFRQGSKQRRGAAL